MVRASLTRRPALAALLATALSACASGGGMPLPTGSAPPPSGNPNFSAADFAWSKASGPNVIAGRITYKQGAQRYSCSGSAVVLTPETTWSRRRMAALYGSTERSAMPADEVRARTPSAPAGDASPFVKRTTCTDGDQFTFSGLPDGAWYAITVARPVGDPKAAGVALMRRVVVRGGKPANITL